MKLIFTGTYKSLGAFETEELPKFVIITGENGSGKSQLFEQFEMLEKVNKRIINDLYLKLQIHPKPNEIFSKPFNVAVSSQIDSTNHIGMARGFFTNYQNFLSKAYFEDVFRSLYKNNFTSEKIRKLAVTPTDYTEFLKILEVNQQTPDIEVLKQLIEAYHNRRYDGDYYSLTQMLIGILKEVSNIYDIAFMVANDRNKNIVDLEEVDFINAQLPNYLFDSTYLFNSKLENIFYTFLRKRNTYYYNEFKSRIKDFYKIEEEFSKKNNNPFKEINDLFERLNLNYYFKEISDDEFSLDAKIEIQLIKKSTEKKIPINDISSGEKVIIDLVIKVFNIKYYNERLQYPDVVILDEPDANLHPSMSQLLIKTLNDEFANNLGINVIITTHSPSTIALAPENSIYELRNTPTTSLLKITKDEALKVLTRDLPNISIDYKNHKQIFVEGETDQMYYSSLFNTYRREQNISNDFYFISAGNGENNCNTVINTTKALRDSNSKNVFGIIDWDLNNKSEKYIQVHGERIYYSIENVILNPLYLSVLFLETGEEKCHIDLDISLNENFYKLTNNEEFITKACHWYLDKFTNKNKSFSNQDLIKIELYSSKYLEVPKKYLEHRGHDLESIVVNTFPSLNKYVGQGKLYEKLIRIICKCYPNVPKTTIDVFNNILKV